MTHDPLPLEGATPSDVRLAAWRHAHQAHLLSLTAENIRDSGSGSDLQASYLEMSAQTNAVTALALLGCVDLTGTPGYVPHAR